MFPDAFKDLPYQQFIYAFGSLEQSKSNWEERGRKLVGVGGGRD